VETAAAAADRRLLTRDAAGQAAPSSNASSGMAPSKPEAARSR
jgi:hypothetical protein